LAAEKLTVDEMWTGRPV